MSSRVYIQLLGSCVFHVDDKIIENAFYRSRKGISLMEYLILQEGKPVTRQRLIRELWSTKQNASPENALKTMVSRIRVLLNAISPGLGLCVVSEKNAYLWQSLPHVEVDVLELLGLFSALRKAQPNDVKREMLRRVMKLYGGDLFQTGDLVNGSSVVSWLHKEFMEAVYAYIELLKEENEYEEICAVCKEALKVDDLDERLHIELMRALVGLNRITEAMTEYKRVAKMSRRYFEAEPSEEMKACYREMNEAVKTLKFNIDTIRNELIQRDHDQPGPFFCDYLAFKEIYNIQIRNLERLGSTMFLVVIMVGGPEESISAVSRESAMAGLQEILRKNLRKGDIVTRFSPTIYAMLLPTVNYSTGAMVMTRLEELFYEEYPSGAVQLRHLISPLGGPDV